MQKHIQFLWAAAYGLISLTITITQDSDHVKNSKDNLQDKFILAGTLSAPDPS